jgi:aryl-alcohol dehydrogenase-like predicted oxidoreductase
MELRRLGRSELAVSRIGLGLAALGRPGYINLGHGSDMDGRLAIEQMEARAHRVLDAAWERGVRYFDAARSYGRAESFLGSWLASRKIGTEGVTIGSKWGYIYTADWRIDADVHEVKDHSVANLQRQLRETRERLGDHLDLYQIHSAAPESGVLENEDVLSELARLRDGGLQIGLSVSGVSQADTIRRAMGTRRGGDPLFSSVQATWNLLERAAGEALAEAHAEGMGVIVKEALANGRLTSRNADAGMSRRLSPLREAAGRLEVGVETVALIAVLAQPWADVVLSGAVTPEQLSENVEAAGVRGHQMDLKAMDAVEAMEPEQYWRQRTALPWT